MPDELVRDNHAKLVVTYLAHWAHSFYGITDGLVTTFRLATVSPDANGMFQIDQPYFSADAEAPSSQLTENLQLMLRDSKTWNAIVFNLEPEVLDFRPEDRCLRVRSYYPDGLNFVPPGRLSSACSPGRPLFPMLPVGLYFQSWVDAGLI